MPQSIKILFREPNGAVWRGYGRVETDARMVGNLELLYLSSLGVQPGDFIQLRHIRNPAVSSFVRIWVPRESARAWKFIFYVHNFHGRIAEVQLQILVCRQLGRRMRQCRILAEERRKIGNDIFSLLIVDTNQHGVAHVIYSVAPAVFVALYFGHATFKPMTTETAPNKLLFTFRLRQ